VRWPGGVGVGASLATIANNNTEREGEGRGHLEAKATVWTDETSHPIQAQSIMIRWHIYGKGKILLQAI